MPLRLTLERYFRDDDGNDRPWLFPQLLKISKDWTNQCLTLKDNTFPQLLLLAEFSHDAADRIYKAIISAQTGAPTLKPILQPYDVLGSTRYVDFDTIRPTYATRADKCHVSHVVAHTAGRALRGEHEVEAEAATALRDLDERRHEAGYLGRERGMARHQSDFFRRQPAWLQEHLVGHADFADVV